MGSENDMEMGYIANSFILLRCRGCFGHEEKMRVWEW